MSQDLKCELAEMTKELVCLQLDYVEQQQQEAQRDEASAQQINFLNAELDDALRSQAEQQSTFSRRLEYLQRVLTPLP